MVPVAFPKPEFRIKSEVGKEFIFDPLRKKWLLLTPEEWVRQNFVQYLVQEKKYPVSLIALEKELRLGELKKRFDILIYDTHHLPWMMVECKASSIQLDDSVLQQILRYNITIPVPLMVITNGNLTYAWERKNDKLELIKELPDWK